MHGDRAQTVFSLSLSGAARDGSLTVSHDNNFFHMLVCYCCERKSELQSSSGSWEERTERMDMAFIHCMLVCIGARSCLKKGKILKAADYRRLIEEFSWEEGGGKEGANTGVHWGGGRRRDKDLRTQSVTEFGLTENSVSHFLKEEKSHVPFNANIHPDRYHLLAPSFSTASGKTQKETKGRLKGKKLNKGQRGKKKWKRGWMRNLIWSRLMSLEGMGRGGNSPMSVH